MLSEALTPTAGTISNAARVLHAEGAREVYACATHAVFSPPAVERLSSGLFQEVRHSDVFNSVSCVWDASIAPMLPAGHAALTMRAAFRICSTACPLHGRRDCKPCKVLLG